MCYLVVILIFLVVTWWLLLVTWWLLLVTGGYCSFPLLVWTTWSCLWDLHFLVCFCYFWKGKFLFVLNLFISENLDQITPMEGTERGIFSKASDWKSLFLPKIKIKQNSGCPNKEYNGILKHIHIISGSIPEVKKLGWSIIRKIFLHIGKNPSTANS